MTTWLDGGLATTLQRRGLPSHTPVNAWLEARPDAVRAAHGAFVQAGAAVVLTGTLRLLPHLDPRWPGRLDRALRVALEAASDQAEVWCALGPASTAEAQYLDQPESVRRELADSWVTTALRSVRRGARAVVLETFVDPGEACDAVRYLRRAMPDTLLVASLVPDATGHLLDGSDPKPAMSRLLEAGADGVGFNCGDGPEAVEAALARCAGLEARWWAKPACGPDREATAAALRRLAARCTWVGGCCGVDPELLGEAIGAKPA